MRSVGFLSSVVGLVLLVAAPALGRDAAAERGIYPDLGVGELAITVEALSPEATPGGRAGRAGRVVQVTVTTDLEDIERIVLHLPERSAELWSLALEPRASSPRQRWWRRANRSPANAAGATPRGRTLRGTYRQLLEGSTARLLDVPARLQILVSRVDGPVTAIDLGEIESPGARYRLDRSAHEERECTTQVAACDPAAPEGCTQARTCCSRASF